MSANVVGRGGAYVPGLRGARVAARLTQDRLSERSGVNPATISYLEAGHRRASFETIEKLAAAIGVPAELLTGEGG